MLYDEMTYIVHNKRATYGHSSKIYFEKRDLVNSGMLCSLRIADGVVCNALGQRGVKDYMILSLSWPSTADPCPLNG